MLQKWRAHGALTYAGYILGFPGDTQGVDPARHRDHQARTAARRARILLPHPAAGLRGSPEPVEAGRLDGPRHQQIRPQPPRFASSQDVGRGMGGGLSRRRGTPFIRPSTCGRSCAAPSPIPRRGPKQILATILWFNLMIDYEGVHPLEGGAFRRKYRRDRRAGLPLENPLTFYPRLAAETAQKAAGYLSHYRRFKAIYNEEKKTRARRSATSRSLRPRRTSSRRLSFITPPAAARRARAQTPR